ncbi:hypothetical protein TNCV_329041 [Trichonephila clavipes]|nr:hypothetical protein TNCV_329041 [Trichonephila clavipes]
MRSEQDARKIRMKVCIAAFGENAQKERQDKRHFSKNISTKQKRKRNATGHKIREEPCPGSRESLRRALKEGGDRYWSGKEGKTMNASGVGELE